VRELELEQIQTQMTQKPMLRAEVYARALRASQNRKEDSVRQSVLCGQVVNDGRQLMAL